MRGADARVQPFDDPVGLLAACEDEGGQRGGALRVRRQLADLDAAERDAQRLDPLRAVRREVVLGSQVTDAIARATSPP